METKLFMLTEHSPFMMGFVFHTAGGKAIVVDGGRPEDMPYLLELVGDREIALWLLTHPHFDHFSGFNQVIRDPAIRERVKLVCHHFPSVEFVRKCEPQWEEDILTFAENRVLFLSKEALGEPGMKFFVDELMVEILYYGGARHYLPKPNLAVNESSMAFKVTGEGLRSVLFLGDLGPEGGRELLALCPEKLPSDIVQMVHHGHSGVTEEVYQKIHPTACLWCAPEWLWNEADVEFEPELWGTLHTRGWMEKMGVTEHYVTKDGTLEIPLK